MSRAVRGRAIAFSCLNIFATTHEFGRYKYPSRHTRYRASCDSHRQTYANACTPVCHGYMRCGRVHVPVAAGGARVFRDVTGARRPERTGAADRARPKTPPTRAMRNLVCQLQAGELI
ncbi:hypothetical protein MRX96_019751 [Rhipicephalus microplus]